MPTVLTVDPSGRNPSPAVLRAKTDPPSVANSQVIRTQVCERICGTPAAKLLLVSAPAGFGKTTAMLQARAALKASGVATAWLTLDRGDNDLPRFLECLTESLRGLQEPLFSQATGFALIEALSSYDAPLVLFLDDFEAIQEPAVLAVVRKIIDNLPRRGQLVLGSRSLPDLGLGRLRTRGQLVEVDAEHLRFSLSDAREFFKVRGTPVMPQQDLVRLHGKTEGWIAALWLASLALERRDRLSEFIERFSGSTREIAEYLTEDVLAHQSTERREFLLRTSILRDFNLPLCQALNPHLDCVRLLEQLDAANLFIIPVVGRTNEWRYHSLFADFLRAQLARQQPEQLVRLHLTASSWYEAQGQPVPAIDHAIEGGDFPYALSLLAQHGESLMKQGRVKLLARWFSAISEESLKAYPGLRVLSVWAACFTQGPWVAMERLERSGCLSSTDLGVRANVNALRTLLLAMMDRYEEAYSVGSIGMALLPTSKPLADCVLTNAMANVVAVRGEQGEARRLLDQARSAPGASAFVWLYAEAMEGVLDLQAGRLRQATVRFRIAVTSVGEAPAGHMNGNAWAGVLYALTLYEADQIDQADHLLNLYLPLACNVGLPDHMILSHVMRSRIASHRGDIDAAYQVLTELENLGHQRRLPRVTSSAKVERARILLLQGNARASQDELGRADDHEQWGRLQQLCLPAHETDDLLLGRLRWDIHFGESMGAAQTLLSAAAEADALARHRRAMKMRVLLGLAQYRSGDFGAATQTMMQVLRQSAAEGSMRHILDEGPLAGVVVRLCQSASDDAPGNGTDPIFSNYLQRLLSAFGPLIACESEGEEATPAPEHHLTEPLTRKEILVLQLLAEGYSNSAMAQKLFVSDSTVRTHLRNINAKLDANSRTHAVAVARKLGVIR
jgi:LuxR family maltose regulon positive regulatory protein